MRLLQALQPDSGMGSSSLEDHNLLDNVPWLDENWMFLGLLGGILAFCWLFSSRWPGTLTEKLHNPVWLTLLATPVYSIHQFEEHGYDILGRRYMFVPVFNAGTLARKLETNAGVALYVRAVTLVNVMTIWVIFPLLAMMANKKNKFYPATLPWGIAVFNGLFGHLLPFFTEEDHQLRYVPGAVQSAFMVPLGLWVLLVVFKKNGIVLGTGLPLVFGVLWHGVGIVMPMFLLTSLVDNIRIPLFLILASFGPVILTSTPWFQNKLAQPEKANVA